MKKIFTMVKSLMSSDKESLSSKRFVGLVSFGIVALTALCNLFFKLTMEEFIFFGLLGLIAACFGLNTVLTSKAMTLNTPKEEKEEDNGKV